MSWKLADGSVGSGEYDTVLFAIGRDVCTSAIGIDKATLSEAVTPAPGGITLLPAEPRLAEFEEVSGRLLHPERRLAAALEEAYRGGVRFDHVLLDCSPRADGVLCANALFASSHTLLIVETGAFALQGAIQALKVLEEVAENQGRAPALRVVGTMFDRRTRFARELLVALHSRFGEALFDTVIRTSVRLREAPALGLPVQELDPTCRAAADFAALADEIMALDFERPCSTVLNEYELRPPLREPSSAVTSPDRSSALPS